MCFYGLHNIHFFALQPPTILEYLTLLHVQLYVFAPRTWAAKGLSTLQCIEKFILLLSGGVISLYAATFRKVFFCLDSMWRKSSGSVSKLFFPGNLMILQLYSFLLFGGWVRKLSNSMLLSFLQCIQSFHHALLKLIAHRPKTFLRVSFVCAYSHILSFWLAVCWGTTRVTIRIVSLAAALSANRRSLFFSLPIFRKFISSPRASASSFIFCRALYKL